MFPFFQKIPTLFPFLLSLPGVIFLPLAEFEPTRLQPLSLSAPVWSSYIPIGTAKGHSTLSEVDPISPSSRIIEKS